MRTSFGLMAVLVGCLYSHTLLVAEQIVGWQDVQTVAQFHAATQFATSQSATTQSDATSAKARDFSDVRRDVSLPPAPRLPGLRNGVGSPVRPVQSTSHAGISSTVVPAVTGDLYWSRPVLDMRIIGQSIGQHSALRLSRPPVGVSVGSNTVKSAFVGIK